MVPMRTIVTVPILRVRKIESIYSDENVIILINANYLFSFLRLVLITGSGSFRHGTVTELLRYGSTKTRKFKTWWRGETG